MLDSSMDVLLPVLAQESVNLAGFDWLIIGLYFVLLVGIVWWSSKKQDTTADYFLAGRNVGWFVIGASLFASNIGSEHVVGLAGQGATSGMAMAHYELHAWIMIMLAWVFVPFYYRTGVYTIPEFLEKRFGPTARWILSCVSLVAYVFTKVSVTVYAGAIVFSTLLPGTFTGVADLINNVLGTTGDAAWTGGDAAFWCGAILTVVLTGLYTVFGGLRAVLYTDSVQAILLLIGSICITVIGLEKLGGWGELQAVAKENADAFSLWRPWNDPDFPWLGILIGSPIVGIWYWCTDQYIVQRTLSAKDLTNARRGALWGGILKVSPVFLFLIPGMIGWALHHEGIITIPQRAGGLNGDAVFPTLVSSLLPTGLRGLVIAGLLAALMSSLSSLFNSTASLFTVDIYEKIRPGMPEKHLVRVGRFATIIVVIAGLIWIPVMAKISDGGLYQYLQNVQSYLAPPITAVFLLGLFWTRTTSAAAVWGLVIGFALGLGKTLIQAVWGAGEGKYDNPAFLAYIGDFNFLYFASILFVICLVVIVIASLLTKPPDEAHIMGLTWAGSTEEDRREVRASWNVIDLVMTGIVVTLVLGAYLYFSFWLM